jgi:hypothetical protein
MSNEQNQPRGRASLGGALRKGFRAAYDNLGYVVFVTFVTFAITAGLGGGAVKIASVTRPGMGGIALFLPAVLAAWMCAVGAFYYANKAVYHEHPALGETWTGIRTLFFPALGLLALDLVVTVLLVGDTVFFLAAKGSPIFSILGVACGYVALVWLMMAMYHLPLLVAQLGMESGPRPFVVVRKAFLLTVDNAGFTVGLFAAIIALAIVCAVPALIGTAVFYLGAAAFILTHALRELFVKYGVVEEEPEVVEDKGWPRL